MTEAIDSILKEWIIKRIQLNPPVTLEQIKCAEQTIEYILPTDFKELYLKTNGFKDFDWLSNMFSVWPLQRIVGNYVEQIKKKDDNYTDEDKNAINFISFCDYLIDSHQIGFLKGAGGVYKSYDLCKPIAPSFIEALQLIESNSDLIY